MRWCEEVQRLGRLHVSGETHCFGATTAPFCKSDHQTTEVGRDVVHRMLSM